MELGKAKLRKVGINNLHCALHPDHGVIWTDGSGVYLAPIHVQGSQVQNATSVKLGQFDHVTSVHWSCPGTAVAQENTQDVPSSSAVPPPCHLCVVHQQNVSVWRVSGALPRLSFKQVRKINVRPVPQGCLWHPTNDVLCLLSRHQCSFYFRHDHNKGSYAFPSLESGKISCGCWSPDGRKLILCIGTALLVYRWDDVATNISDFSASAWRIPGLEGQVTSIIPISKDSVVVATEVSLETLCKHQDFFTVPDLNINQNSTTADGIIRPNGSSSASQALLNLQHNEKMTSESDSSSLVLVQIHESGTDPAKLSSVPLKGVITPDILLFESSSQCVVVGSNTQSQIHIYALLDKHLAYCGDVQLEKGQRPKGLCSMATSMEERGAALLILVGQRELEDSAVLSASTESDFKLSLKYIILKSGQDHRSSRSAQRRATHKSHRTSASPSAGHDGRSGSNKRGGADGQGKSLVKSESMREHSLPQLSLGQEGKIVRSRSGSVKQESTVKAAGSAQEDSTISEIKNIVTSVEEAQDLQQGKELLLREPASEHDPTLPRGRLIEEVSKDPTLPRGRLIEEVSKDPTLPTGRLIEEVSKGSPRGAPESQPAVEVETVSFSSRTPSFNNNKLSNMFELHSHSGQEKDGQKVDSAGLSPARHATSSSKINGDVVKVEDRNLRNHSSLRERRSQSPGPSDSVAERRLRLDRDGNVSLDISEKSSSFDSVHRRQSGEGKSGIQRPNQGAVGDNLNIGEGVGKNESPISRHRPDKSNGEEASNLRLSSVVRTSSYHQEHMQESSYSPKQSVSAVLHEDHGISSPRQSGYAIHSDGQSGVVSPRHRESTSVGEFQVGPGERRVGSDGWDESLLSDMDGLLGGSLHSADSGFASVERQVKSQRSTIESLQQRLQQLADAVEETSCIFPTKYQELNKPELVQVMCERGDGTTETKTFLLDNGRLKLETVRLAFGLTVVQLWLDGIPCVLSSNIDGYIPIKFDPSSKLHISGLHASSHELNSKS